MRFVANKPEITVLAYAQKRCRHKTYGKMAQQNILGKNNVWSSNVHYWVLDWCPWILFGKSTISPPSPAVPLNPSFGY